MASSPALAPVVAPRKLAHFRKAGAGDPMWSGKCVYGLAGQSPSISEYDSHDPYGDIDTKLSYAIRNGVVNTHSLREPKEPTLTRDSRVSAHFDSLPAARFFQGYFNPSWSGLMAGFRPVIKPRPLVQGNNPNAFGAKEIHPPTKYKPFPPMGSIVPDYGTAKAL
jgi:hypothetical protein